MKKVFLLVVAVFTAFALFACVVEDATVESLVIMEDITDDEYNVGEDLDLDGLVVKAVYTDGVEVNIDLTEATITGFDNTTVGQQTITVTFGEASVTFQVTVFDPTAEVTLIGLELVSLPTKQIYAVDENFEDAGLEVQAVYSNATKETLTSTDWTITGFDSSAVAQEAALSVSFEDKSIEVPYQVHELIVQGITETTITVGNTATVGGPLSYIGLPFNSGILAYFAQVNANGGVGGRTINFINHDDGFDPTAGLNYTKQLVEEDNVFALVGHFGTPTVGATLSYIQETGVPMVYAATGINGLYFEKEDGLNNPVMAVQPIYKTDGRLMTARVLNESLFGDNGDAKLADGDKVGVLYTSDDAGSSIKEGVDVQASVEGKTDDFVFQSVAMNGTSVDTTSLNSAVLALLDANVEAVILAMNQGPFTASINALNAAGNTAPVFTSYVSANVTAVPGETVDYDFEIFANAWLDISDPEGTNGFSQEYWDFATAMTTYGTPEYAADAFAMAGYIAASVFVQGLERVGEDLLTWESFTKAMEESDINIPMGGIVDFTEGKRWGIASMALLQYSAETIQGDNPATTEVVETEYIVEAFDVVRPIEDISVIEAK